VREGASSWALPRAIKEHCRTRSLSDGERFKRSVRKVVFEKFNRLTVAYGMRSVQMTRILSAADKEEQRGT